MSRIILGKAFLVSCLLSFSACVLGYGAVKHAVAEMYMLDATQDDGMGEVWLSETPAGLVIMLKFTKALTDGDHGFHIHEGESLAPARNSDGKLIAGLAAMGHYDPEVTGKHEVPNGDCHLGDLPILKIAEGKPVDATLR